MDQEHICVILNSLLLLRPHSPACLMFNSAWVAFKWPPPSLVKQTADCDSPYDWLMSLATDLTALCDMWR